MDEDAVVAVHAFSSEIRPFKQRFLRTFGRPEKLFADCPVLGKEKAFDEISTSMRNVPATFLLIAGFVCTDVSH
eukprot:12227385-Prorocentrum_lima.AAC.1